MNPSDLARTAIDLTVVAPCYNEEGNVAELARRTRDALDAAGIAFELILVDDGSTDGTWAAIKEAEADHPAQVRGIAQPINGGMFAAWRTGVAAATGNVVCLIDADLQNPPEAITRLWDELHTKNVHVVQGFRSSIEWDRDARFVSSRGLNLVLNTMFGDRARDNKSGFVMAPRSILADILDFKHHYNYPQTFVRVAARAKGYAVAETETLFQPRRVGTSFLDATPPVKVYADVLTDVVRGLGEFGRGRRHPVEAMHVTAPRSEPPAHGYRGARKILLDTYFASMPMHAWLIRSQTKSIYETLHRTQWFDRDELHELQSWRLQRLIWHAYAHVPYYRRVMGEHGLHPRDISTPEDLTKLPMLSKADVGANLYMDMFADTHRKREMHKIATSGSTGQPFVTYVDRQQLEIRFASTLRSLEWTGWRVGDKQVRLWHQTLGMSPTQIVRERLDATMLRRTFIPAFELTDGGLDSLARRLEEIKPVLIDGYAESLNFLALYLQRGGRLNFQPRAVLSSAQMLTSDTRRQIEDGLGAKVFDKYGAREFSGIAYQCDQGDDHHILDESYIVEILKEGRPALPGELGEVVITDLNNFSVPLIRYRIGDLAVAADNSQACECGRGLSRLGQIQGRTQALVHCANGRWLPGTFFAHFFKEYDHLVQFFQVVQHEHGTFALKIVQGRHWTTPAWDDLLTDLRTYVGDSQIDVHFVDEVPLLATGKRTPVVSTVRPDFQTL
ncbi:glycosyltransferase [Nocardioides piscis]|uniref:Glycosyltransferase n=1 Tax=Nocardioides piscis TaxID=2714938 RepID=A0A6G7YF71_9ACTN|nr:glycosyltransferase [Nocardioides piscis]QIK75455.1 glycosyltransferase [Nocardioides piscis]